MLSETQWQVPQKIQPGSRTKAATLCSRFQRRRNSLLWAEDNVGTSTARGRRERWPRASQDRLLCRAGAAGDSQVEPGFVCHLKSQGPRE